MDEDTKQGLERMDGLIKESDREKFYDACKGIYRELEKEGFENDEIMEFLAQLPNSVK